jgi:hypothetical protein
MKRLPALTPFTALAGIAIVAALLVLPSLVCASEKPTCTLPDCDQAKAFFTKFQKAIDSNERQEVAGMVRYPLHSYLHGKATVIKTKADLLARYDTVFSSGARCAITTATLDDVWGNWRGFTISAGAIWWDRIIPNSATKNGAIQPTDLDKYPFGVFGVNHSPETDKSCPANQDTPAQ